MSNWIVDFANRRRRNAGRRPSCSHGRIACLATLAALATTAARASDKLEYNRDVRPILAENCFACHGPDSAARKAGLRLDRRDDAVKKAAIVPGKPDDSEAIRRLLTDDADERMPPPASHKTLTKAQQDTLVRWVKQGAEYQQHWSFIPPKRPAIPTVRDRGWVRNPIDAFILRDLERNGLRPAAEADRRTLARRASLDITGLPPAVDDVEDFVNDSLPDAYERYLDKLFAKPQWGEHRGRYWLDYARYGDTNGIHFDNYREAWAYRDAVIAAFNRNQRFDQFTIEQLAGDLLPNATLEQKIASGFNRCNITTNEGGVIGEEYLVLYTRDRTETTSQVWLGMTTGCAVCHEHKFDPLSQREFYELAAFFNNTTQGAMDGNIKDTPPTLFVPRPDDRAKWDRLVAQTKDLIQRINERMVGARGDFNQWVKVVKPAEIVAQLPNDTTFHAPLDEGKGDKIRAVVAGKPRISTLAKGHLWGQGAVAERALQPTSNATSPVEWPDVGDIEKDKPFSMAAWINIGKRNQAGSVIARMDERNGHRGWDIYYENGRIAAHIIHRWPDNAIKVVSHVELPIKKWQHVLFTYDGSGKAAGIKLYIDGVEQGFAVHADSLRDGIRTTVPARLGQRHASGKLDRLAVQDVRIYSRVLPQAEAARLGPTTRAAYLAGLPVEPPRAPQPAGGDQPSAKTPVRSLAATDKQSKADKVAKPAVIAKANAKKSKANKRAQQRGEMASKPRTRTPQETDELFAWWIAGIDRRYRDLRDQLAAVERDKQAVEARGTKAHVMSERSEEAMAYLLFRGEYDKRRDPVKPKTPAALPPMPKELPRNRLGFARWLLMPDHPLTARVTVNRFWQEVFGAGLVRTVGDFGVAGELPSHPELLDWLAVEFRDQGWDVKAFFKLLLTSSAYRQSAATTPEKLAKDPNNRLLSRGPRFRMDAEMVRDHALAASGLLVSTLGGPSVKPYQPDGIWEAVAMMESNTRYYQRDSGDNLYRRSMYTLWKRAAPPAQMDIFNAPSREFTCVRRERTNTPLQALMTLNDPTFVEAAKVLAERALKTVRDSDRERLDFIGRRLVARPFQADEAAALEGSLAELRDFYRSQPKDAQALLAVGERKVDSKLDAIQLAAWTMLTNQLMNLDEVLNK